MARETPRDWLGYLFPLLLSVGVLLLLGQLSISAWASARTPAGTEDQKQLVFLCFGVACMLAIQMVNYRRLLRYSLLFFLATLPFLGYTVLSRMVDPEHGLPFARSVNGACAWIQLGSISIEPSEITRVTLIMLLAWLLRHEQHQKEHSLKMLIQSLLIAAFPVVLILLQPDLGMVLTILPPVLVMAFLGGVKKRHLAALFLVAMLALPVLWLSGKCKNEGCTVCPNVPVLNHLPQFVKHYQRLRVEAMISSDPRILETTGYQQQRVLVAMGSGGLRGKGAGNIPISRNVPEAQTDMIIALIGEQYGLVGVCMLLLAYVLLYGTGLAIASVHREVAGKLLVVGLVTLMACQTVFNLGVAMRLFPVTGLTLPFVSYGGSSLISSFLGVGLMINVARFQRKAMF